jgi:hypothetical protein
MANHTGHFFSAPPSLLPLQASCPFSFPSPSVVIMDVQKKVIRQIRHPSAVEGDTVKTLRHQLGGGAYAAKSPPARPSGWDLLPQAKARAVTRLLECWQQRLFANSLSRGDREGTPLPCTQAYIINFLRSYIWEGATATKVPLLVQFVISNIKFDLKIWIIKYKIV